MRTAASKEHFIMLMEAEGYGVKWTDTRKNITYTTPEGKACRDCKLHLTKFLKESMEYEFIYRAEITARFNNRSTAEDHHRRKGSSLRGGGPSRTGLAMISTQRSQIDLLKEIRDTLPTLTTRERVKSVYGSAAEGTDAVHRADQRSDRAVSDGDGNVGAELTENINRLITDTEKQVGE